MLNSFIHINEHALDEARARDLDRHHGLAHGAEGLDGPAYWRDVYGMLPDLDAELGQASLDWAKQSLKPEFRGQSFGPEVPTADNAPVYDKLAAFFGRKLS